MQVEINGSTLMLKTGDITKENVDAIVNAANSGLLGGGGVDGAIHNAGGPAVYEECVKLNGCEPGDAKITGGGNLPARHVIHTVGPIWRGGNNNEEQTLASAYRRSLDTACENGLHSISFPSISTGAYCFPKDHAAKIAISEIRNFLKSREEKYSVTMVLFSEGDLKVYETALTNEMKK
jgi:O-acetyl-ADP-ribose deacetylase